MSELIVDFPQQQRCHINGKIWKKQVHFSPMPDLLLVTPHDTSDATKTWHSREDYKAMKTATKKAVLDFHKEFQDARETFHSFPSSSSVPSEESPLDSCVLTGIENLLTPKIIKKRNATRKNHLNAVLNEQKRQHQSGEYDADRLAFISDRYSKWSVRRAQHIGLLQSK